MLVWAWRGYRSMLERNVHLQDMVWDFLYCDKYQRETIWRKIYFCSCFQSLHPLWLAALVFNLCNITNMEYSSYCNLEGERDKWVCLPGPVFFPWIILISSSISLVVTGQFIPFIWSWFNFCKWYLSLKSSIFFRISNLVGHRFLNYVLMILRVSLSFVTFSFAFLILFISIHPSHLSSQELGL